MRHLVLIFAASLLLVACSAEDTNAQGEAQEGFIRLPAEGAGMTAGYLTVEVEEADILTGVSVEGVARTEMHISFEEDGINRMRRVEGFEVSPGEPLVLEPRGKHLMLIGIDEAMKEGESREVTLTFESGRSQTVELPVRGLAPGRGHQH
ncbi:copper chaperone PCu(A)C [Parvularcula maris]|uniref:Copper chaperone PCu(A)C n=1 Tax=Parvularcula maris TaxID=2965077 RepID=A0A9X2RJ89_9PROT|nr:copper chaperone PCu(A)C [Parvularcula maris]MCQ8184547.1 copper chaperone PCu(A)C [Parvularcula maris]